MKMPKSGKPLSLVPISATRNATPRQLRLRMPLCKKSSPFAAPWQVAARLRRPIAARWATTQTWGPPHGHPIATYKQPRLVWVDANRVFVAFGVGLIHSPTNFGCQPFADATSATEWLIPLFSGLWQRYLCNLWPLERWHPARGLSFDPAMSALLGSASPCCDPAILSCRLKDSIPTISRRLSRWGPRLVDRHPVHHL